MITTTTRNLGIAASALGFALLAVAAVTPAGAHPHNLLAMCQLPDGSWVSCDDTIHDTFTNEHVKKNHVHTPDTKIKGLTKEPPKRPTFRIHR